MFSRARVLAVSSARCFMLAAGLCLLPGQDALSAETDIPNRAPNAGFEQAAGELPAGWQTRTWAGAGEHTYPQSGRGGGRCVAIASGQGGDLSWSADVPVQPNTLYRLSGWIRTENLQAGTGRGALLNVHQVRGAATPAVTDTSDWTRVESLVYSGDRETLLVNCLFGGWGRSTGTAWYDDLRLEAVDVDVAYVKRATWAETMVASRQRLLELGGAGQGEGGALRARLWAALNRDFLWPSCQFQARLAACDGADWFARAADTDLERTILAEELASPAHLPAAERSRFQAELDALTRAEASPHDHRRLDLFERLAAAKGAAMLGQCPPVAFLKRQAGGLHGTNATMLARRTGVGSAICVFDPAHPQHGARTIFDDPEGFILDMGLSYDAKRIVFAYKKEAAGGRYPFRIYEIGVDGSGLRQVSTGPYHDVSPMYLPDGRIVFNSTRVEAYSMCQDFLAAALYVMDADGTNVRRLEYNTLCNTTPYVLDDGSILFTRWEYQDKNIFCTQGLWTINPDGSRLQLFYGNTLTVPNAIYGAKQIPGTRKTICVMAAHHFPPLGGIAVIDRSHGLESAASMRTLTPEVPYRVTKGHDWKETSWGPGDVFHPWSYTDPWPLAEDLFLVAYGGPLKNGPQRYRLSLMDATGLAIPLYDDAKTSCFHPMPLAPRLVPHQLPGEPPPEPEGEGCFFVQDVYEGLVQWGVERGQVKQLRVMSQAPKRYNTEGPRYSDHYPAIGEGTYYVKVNYGTVPVAEDGSAYFVAPAGVEFYFQALDAGGKEIRRMGTVTQITAGETQSCIGCHESRFRAPAMRRSAMERLRRPPDPITAPSWGPGPVDFVEQVQPVLDRYCVECHQGPDPEGGVDLSGDKTRFFNMAYETLVFTPGLVAAYHLHGAPTGNFPPLATGSYVSRLTELLEGKHADVDVDAESRRRVYTWIDANIPYYGTWAMCRPHTVGGRDTWLGLGQKPLPWFAAFAEAYRTAGLPGDLAPDTRINPRYFPHQIEGLRHADVNLTRPQYSRVLRDHLAESAGGRAEDGKAAFQTPDDPRYQAMLRAIEQGKAALLAHPRIDMPGAAAVPQDRHFGRTF